MERMQKLRGLNQEQVTVNQKKWGKNVIAKKARSSAWRLLISQFGSPVMLVLVAAGSISYYLHGVTDAIVVWGAVVINGLLGFVQEYRAEKALAELEKMVEITAEVIREGERKVIPVEEVVVGDIVLIKAGDQIPADGVVREQSALTINEAMLTGESIPVNKQETNSYDWDKVSDKAKTFMGTIVTSGLGKLEIMRVGEQTRMGQIASSLALTKRTLTKLQIAMKKFARFITVVVVVLTGGLLLVGLQRGIPLKEMLLVAVAVAVSAIPEGMVVTLTVILSLGMQRLLKRNGLVRKLLVAESLGRVSIVCADKTGTLTTGEMRVVEAEGERQRMAEDGLLSSDMADPIEMAIVKWAEEDCRIEGQKCEVDEWKRVHTLPFNPSWKYGMSVSRKGKENRIIMRGAPEVVLKYTRMSKSEIDKWQKRFTQLGNRGYRLVAIAETIKNQDISDYESCLREVREKRELMYLGIVIMEDPIREGIAKEIEQLEVLGVKFKVITGDFAETARYVVEKLGIQVKEAMIRGEEFRKMSEKEQQRAVKETIVFARFSPTDKIRVVELLQESGETVAMMGDGINDAPALKKANVGIVVSSAAEVAKKTADMVLLDNQFGTVIAGIEEGRSIFERIRRVVRYLLSDSFAEVLIVAISLLLGIPLPITAAQILWINLANDTFPAMALAVDPIEKEEIQNGINNRTGGKDELIDKEAKILVGIVSTVS